MQLLVHTRFWVVWVGCLLLVMLQCAVSSAWSEDSRTRELRLSRVAPGEAGEFTFREEGDVERMLAETLRGLRGAAGELDDWVPKIPYRDEFLRSRDRRWLVGRETKGDRAGITPKYPFSSKPWRVASLKPMVPATRPTARTMLDAMDVFASAGSLVGAPSRLFSRFEVLVSLSKFTLEVYGIRNERDRKLLYSCRVGIGSREYPTPRGAYYLLRIYDDKPLWIPPPRDWAWGQYPSHSVYGGHMLPLFKKVRSRSGRDESEPIVSLDNIASQMELIDAGMYRIHGTDSPWSIGAGQSHGCVRLHNRSAKQLSETLKHYVGETARGKSANGPYATLAKPVKLILY